MHILVAQPLIYSLGLLLGPPGHCLLLVPKQLLLICSAPWEPQLVVLVSSVSYARVLETYKV